MSRQEAKFKLRIHHTSYLLLETLYANYYLQNGHIDEARIHLKKMNEYFSPTDYIPCRGLYYDVYAQYYRITQMYDKALIMQTPPSICFQEYRTTTVSTTG